MLNQIFRSVRAAYLGMRGMSLYLMQLPLWFGFPIALFRNMPKAAITAVVIGLITYGAILTQRYFLQCRTNYLQTGEAFALQDNRPHAMGFVALGTLLLMLLVARRPLLFSVISSALAALGYYLRYIVADNPDVDDNEPQRVPTDHLNPTLRKMLDNAYLTINTLEQQARQLRAQKQEAKLGAMLAEIASKAREIIALIYEKPERIRQARTFLVVYLDELQDVSQRYLEYNDGEHRFEQRQSFMQLLEETQVAFHDQKLALSQAQHEQLDIHIQVLREQLRQKGNHE